MVLQFQEFEKRIIDELRNSKLIERFSINEFEQNPNLNIISHYFEYPSCLDFDDQGLYFIDEKDDKCYCPDIRTSISDKGEWISDKLPPLTFDIDQAGNVRKADEAESLYICVQVAHIIKEESFKKDLDNVANSYNFEQMSGRTISDSSFRDLLKEWQSFQSVIINIIISAAKYRISSSKKDVEKFLKDGIQDSTAAELRDLETRIRSINFKYSQGTLAPDRVKTFTKIERLSEIQNRDDEISSQIASSSVGNLYRAINLSSEYISPIKKKKLSLWVQEQVDILLQTDEFSNLNQDRKSILSKFTRRAYRFERSSVRKLAVEAYLSDPNDFRLPAKL